MVRSLAQIVSKIVPPAAVFNVMHLPLVGQTVENEHPAALWAWRDRWGIANGSNTLVPRDVYHAWKNGNVSTSSQAIEQCDWNETTCNLLCPLFT